MEKYKLTKIVSVASAFILSMSLASAEVLTSEKEEQNVQVLEPVEITALRFADSVYDTAIIGINVSQAQIENSGLTSVSQVLNRYTDVYIRETGGGVFLGQPSLRGFGENSQSRVLVLLDGQKLNPIDMGAINWGQIQLSDVENIEVLYGAQTATYGNFAETGVIKISTKKWSQNGGVIGGIFGERGEYSAYGSYSYSNDDYYVNIGANYYHANGYFTNSLNWNKSATFSAGIRLDSLNELGVYFNIGDMFISWPGYIYAQSSQEFKNSFPNGLVHTQKDRLGYLTASLSWENKTTYGEGSAHLGVNMRDREAWNAAQWGNSAYIIDSTLWTLSFDPKYRVKMGKDEQSYIEGGADFYYDNFYAHQENSFSSLLQRYTIAPWMAGKLQLNDVFSFTASARYEASINDADAKSANLDGSELVNGVAAQIGINAKINESWNVYFRFDQIFHYPSIDERYSLWGWGPAYNNANLDPEHGQNYEIGTNFSKYGFSLNASLFYTHLNDEIAYDGLLYGNINIGDTNRYGAQVRLSYNYEDLVGAFTSWQVVSAEYASGSYKGKDVPLVPKVSSKSGVWVKPVEYVMLELNFIWSGKQYQYGYADPYGPEGKIGENYSLDLTLNVYPCKNARIFFGISNITDHANCSYANWNYWYPEAGRTIRGGVEFKF